MTCAAPVSAAERFETASLSPARQAAHDADLPAILDTGDVARYRTILDLQRDGEWAAADRAIAALDDRLLLGHVFAQRYLHRAYRSRYEELRAWLSRYADEPDAAAIYALALRRRPGGTPAPAKPVGSLLALRGIVDARTDLRPPTQPARSDDAAHEKLVIRRLAHSDPATAEEVLQRDDAAQMFSDADYDEARADVAEGYLFAGDSRAALRLAAASRSAAYRPLAHWDAGLASWQLGRLAEARSHFEALARMPDLSRWTRGTAAFWAARVHERRKRHHLAEYWLRVAAAQTHTFYGLLARRMLGLPTTFDHDPAGIGEIDLDAVTGIPAARRALALLQLGERNAAQSELRMLASGAPSTLYPALAALADRGNMPALSVQLATMLQRADGCRHDPALFPMPRWIPAGGYSVDRALLFALIRQESQFLPDAESQSGAIGLMQLMPSTAEAMARRLGLSLGPVGNDGGPLREPQLNVTLGQEFVSTLLDNDQIGGNLILLAAAYNSGPGNVLRWRSRPEYRDDPLLFIESLPSRETRVFVERVLTNYWIYRLRLDQPTADLDALAAGAWPVYVAFDTPSYQVVSNASPR